MLKEVILIKSTFNVIEAFFLGIGVVLLIVGIFCLGIPLLFLYDFFIAAPIRKRCQHSRGYKWGRCQACGAIDPHEQVEIDALKKMQVA